MFRKDKFNRKIGYIFLVISTSMGFLIFAPMFPNQFQLLILGKKGSEFIVVGLLLFIILTFVFGRIFCGYLCPIGSIQELAYYMPSKKLKISNRTVPITMHFLFFGIFLISGFIFSIGILNYLGFRDFFHLNIASLSFYVFLALLIVSIFIYRPFCRFFCPYSLLSLASAKSILKLRRNDNCVDCKSARKFVRRMKLVRVI